jgi:hypothetical protein
VAVVMMLSSVHALSRRHWPQQGASSDRRNPITSLQGIEPVVNNWLSSGWASAYFVKLEKRRLPQESWCLGPMTVSAHFPRLKNCQLGNESTSFLTFVLTLAVFGLARRTEKVEAVVRH